MKKGTVIVATLILGFLFAAGGYGQEKAGANAGGTHQGPGKKAAIRLAGLRRAAAKPAFTGKVVEMNAMSETFSLRSRGALVTFDASNPKVSGYRDFSDVRVGDVVAVAYTPGGIRVTRQGGRLRAPDGEPSGKGRVKRVAGIMRLEARGSGFGFDDADANKDGRLTPVELSTLIPDITVERFREFDANKDGYLDRAEFARAMKLQRAMMSK
jgi:hypothetical protein